MKKIITALGNSKLNDELRKTEKYEVVTKDIFYKEGILEVLEEFPNVDTIIISELLEGEISFEILIEEIINIKRDIDIIVFVEKKTPELQSFLFKNGIYKIYENNEIELERFIDSLQDKVNLQVEEFKIRKEEVINRSYLGNINFEATGKVIAITGSYNSGKSSITCILAKEYAKQGKKTLIVLCGETFGRYFYLALGVVAVLILHLLFHEALPEKSGFTLIHWCCLFVMPIIYLLLHYFTWRKISLIRQGRVLNTLIGETSRNMLIFSLTFAIGFAIIGY